MQPGALAFSDSMFYESRVLVNGVVRECESWNVGRELSGDLPVQVAAVSGLVQATGTITWVEENDVDDMPTSPFNTSSGWLPRRGNRVEIFAGDGTTEWKVFTGLVDSSSGDVSGSFQSKIIDDRDKLSADFRHEPLLRIMPPNLRGEADYRGVGLTYLYFVDAALRTSGFYATPPVEARQAVSVPAQSSMWPEVGVMTKGTVGGFMGTPISWCNTHNGVDGVSVSNVYNEYGPIITAPYGEMFRLSATIDTTHTGTAYVIAFYGTAEIQLAIAGSRTITARLNGVTVCSLVMGSAVRVSLVVEGNSWELRTNTGTVSTGTITAPTSVSLSKVTVRADDSSRISGVHACFTAASTKWDYTSFEPTSRYLMGNQLLFGIIDASPSVLEGSCFDLLDEISQATLSAMWIDEHGVFNWGPSPSLASSPPVRELTTAEDVLSMPWEDNLLGTRSKVTVKHRIPAITLSRWDNVLWHQGSVETMESSQTKNEFISPDAETEWVGPIPQLLVLGDPGSSAPSNSGHGSFTGGVLTDGTTEDVGSPYLTASLEKVNAGTYKLKHQTGSMPSGKKMELRYFSSSTTIWPRWLKQSFPIIRGFATTTFTDAEVVGSPAGPSWAPVLEHDSGPWLSREDGSLVAGRLANYLSSQTAGSSPTISGLEVIPDPRLQLGDLITVRSDQYIGAVFTAIITGITLGGSGTFTQSLSVRLTSLESTFQSYDAWNTQYPGVLTYDQWAVLTTQTYNQFAISKD